jgi:hypothetical protein
MLLSPLKLVKLPLQGTLWRFGLPLPLPLLARLLAPPQLLVESGMWVRCGGNGPPKVTKGGWTSVGNSVASCLFSFAVTLPRYLAGYLDHSHTHRTRAHHGAFGSGRRVCCIERACALHSVPLCGTPFNLGHTMLAYIYTHSLSLFLKFLSFSFSLSLSLSLPTHCVCVCWWVGVPGIIPGISSSRLRYYALPPAHSDCVYHVGTRAL